MAHRILPFPLMLAFIAILITACAGTEPVIELAPVSDLPASVQRAPSSVRTDYQFAVANPEALANVPCYCGCGSIGHHSNLTCYVKSTDAAGKPVFDDHALGCSICVDIALDVKKMMEEGQERIQATYGENHARLSAVKKKYDPDNLFRVNQNIKPAP